MSLQRTPGQVAYEAYWRGSDYGRVPVAWKKLLPRWRKSWEAAAQAVLEAFVASTRPVTLHLDEETP